MQSNHAKPLAVSSFNSAAIVDQLLVANLKNLGTELNALHQRNKRLSRATQAVFESLISRLEKLAGFLREPAYLMEQLAQINRDLGFVSMQCRGSITQITSCQARINAIIQQIEKDFYSKKPAQDSLKKVEMLDDFLKEQLLDAAVFAIIEKVNDLISQLKEGVKRSTPKDSRITKEHFKRWLVKILRDIGKQFDKLIDSEPEEALPYVGKYLGPITKHFINLKANLSPLKTFDFDLGISRLEQYISLSTQAEAMSMLDLMTWLESTDLAGCLIDVNGKPIDLKELRESMVIDEAEPTPTGLPRMASYR